MTFSYLLGQAASSLIISEEISAELIVAGAAAACKLPFHFCSLSVGMLRHTPVPIAPDFIKWHEPATTCAVNHHR